MSDGDFRRAPGGGQLRNSPPLVRSIASTAAVYSSTGSESGSSTSSSMSGRRTGGAPSSMSGSRTSGTTSMGSSDTRRERQRRAEATQLPEIFKTIPVQLLIELDNPPTERLGQGSFGTVFRGQLHGADVAVKFIHAYLVRDTPSPEQVKFMDELSRLCQCNHPNIIQFVGVTSPKYGNVPGIVMEELVCTLRERYNSHPSLTGGECVSIAYDVACGLSYLHSLRILHRDLTTNNVMLSSSQQGAHAKITDVGGSRQLGDGAVVADLTSCPGNQSYMAPETLKEDMSRTGGGPRAVYGYSSDIYSLGVLILAMSIRREPPHVYTLAISGHVADVEQLGEANALYGIVVACLEEQPTARPRAKPLVATLRELKRQHPLEHMAGSITSSPPGSMDDCAATERQLRKDFAKANARMRVLTEEHQLALDDLAAVRVEQAEERRKMADRLDCEEEASRSVREEASRLQCDYNSLLQEQQQLRQQARVVLFNPGAMADGRVSEELLRNFASMGTGRSPLAPVVDNRTMSQSFTQGTGKLSQMEDRARRAETRARQAEDKAARLQRDLDTTHEAKEDLRVRYASLKNSSDSSHSISSNEASSSAEVEGGRAARKSKREANTARLELERSKAELRQAKHATAVAERERDESKSEVTRVQDSRDHVVQLQDKLVSTLLSRVSTEVGTEETRALAATYFLLGAGRGRQRLEDCRDLPKWKFCGELPPQASNRCNQVCLHDGFLYVGVAMGDGDELNLLRAPFDKLSVRSWKSVPLPLGQAWNYHCYLLSFNGLLHIILAGLDRSERHKIHRLGPNDTWEYVTEVPLVRKAFGVGVRGSLLAIVGGCCGMQYGRDDPVLTPDVYDAGKGLWRKLPWLPKYSKSPMIVNYAGGLHVIGGHGYVEDDHHTVRSLDISQPIERQHWTSGTLPKVSYRRCGAATINNQLVVAGGQWQEEGMAAVNAVRFLDRSSRHWVDLPPLQQEMFSPRLVSDGERVVCLGGFDARGHFLHRIECLEIELES